MCELIKKEIGFLFGNVILCGYTRLCPTSWQKMINIYIMTRLKMFRIVRMGVPFIEKKDKNLP